MNNNDYDLIALLQKVPTATVSLQLSDLNTFSRRLIAQTREEYEREITGRLEAFRYPHVPALGAKGMERVASNALHGTYDSGKGLNAHINNVARIAQILYPDNDSVRGNSWSGKSALSEEQRRQLRELERSGAANASFEDTTYVEFLG